MLLNVQNMECGYGKKQVLFDISLKVEAGEIVAIIGPNGAGKSTILKAISGLIPAWQGKINFNGNDITKQEISKNIAAGITFCPQGNRVFDELTVKENLEIGGFNLKKQILFERIDNVLSFFPELRHRLKEYAGNLSGGEQQKLALSRALIPKPKLLLLDEPSLGLAPNILKDVFDKFKKINNEIGTSILIVEQKVHDVLNISDRVYAIRLGRVGYEGPAEDLKDNTELLKKLFL